MTDWRRPASSAVEKEAKAALKVALGNVKNGPHYFAFAPSVILKPKDPAKAAQARPEPVIVVDKMIDIKVANFTKKVQAQLEEEVKVAPSLILVGRMRQVKNSFVLEVDRKLSKGTIDVPKAQKLARELGKTVGVEQLKKSLVSDGPLADTNVRDDEPEENEAESQDPDGQGAVENDQARHDRLAASVTALLAQFPDRNVPAAKTLFALQEEAAKRANAGKWAEAADILEQVERAAPGALRAAKDAEQAGGRPDVAAFSKSRLIWSQARDVANKEIRKLQRAILTDDATRRHPNFPAIVKNVEKLGGILAEYGTLDDALDRYQAASTEEKRAETYEESKRLLAAYRARIARNAFLQQIDGNPYIEVAVFQTLTTSLDAVGKLLRA